ncbi:hypothetical protein [Adhaeretor mobilis]|uniref:Uncharacterized protein n=1 Tax=Adhaeretor mobilis TaxID=1930276 RepID=A0A517MVI3_9BACT|nr:hypothetical protein [Adhaeretor mobilis]QDS98890.1 hypothetical protein HG15A2_21780 [Adhaeretor mobilis]
MVQINLNSDQMKLIAEATKKTEEIAIADDDGKIMVRFARFAKAASDGEKEEDEIIAEARRRMASTGSTRLFSEVVQELKAKYGT